MKNKTCPECGCEMTVEDDGRPKHVGRVFGVPDSYFCVARQRDQLVEQNRELVERIKRLNEAGDEMFKWSERVGQEYWMKAKEAKP